MLSRWVRLVSAFAIALAAWSIATPARASAPICDPRGATMEAPAPVLQAPITVLDAAAAPDQACGPASTAGRAWTGGRAPSPEAAPMVAADPATPADESVATRPETEKLRAPREGGDGERTEERSRVDRPPRG